MRAPLGASVTLLEATTPVKLPTKRCPRIRVLASRQQKGRISTSAPRELASPLHSLRPILHISGPDATLSYSKGSRGLFVPSRVIGIFTDTTISLRSWLRQCRYSYGRRLLGLQFNASLAVTSPLNLPAPGRCQAVYVVLRLSTALCFW